MNNRIVQLRKYLGLTQEAFGKKIGLTDAMVSMLESGKKTIQNRTISLICYTFVVNEDWLRYGSGNMMASKAETEDERQLLAMFDKLSDEMKRVVLQKVNDLLAADGAWAGAAQIMETEPVYEQSDASRSDANQIKDGKKQ